MLSTAVPTTRHILLFAWTKSQYSFLLIFEKVFVQKEMAYHMRTISISVMELRASFLSPNRYQAEICLCAGLENASELGKADRMAAYRAVSRC